MCVLNDLFLQVTIEARDNHVNPRTDTGTVRINVVRNQGPPVFTSNANYFATIDENLQVTSSVLTVSATDSDSQVLPFSSLAKNFVRINLLEL